MLTTEVLNEMCDDGSIPRHELELQLDGIYFLMRNLDVEEGLTNNTRVRLIEINTWHVRVQTLDSNPRCFTIPRIRFPFRHSQFNNYSSFEITRYYLILIYSICFTL